jgi:TRAP-type mannitol/chloroaromatic compound transport system permease large subunit
LLRCSHVVLKLILCILPASSGVLQIGRAIGQQCSERCCVMTLLRINNHALSYRMPCQTLRIPICSSCSMTLRWSVATSSMPCAQCCSLDVEHDNDWPISSNVREAKRRRPRACGMMLEPVLVVLSPLACDMGLADVSENTTEKIEVRAAAAVVVVVVTGQAMACLSSTTTAEAAGAVAAAVVATVSSRYRRRDAVPRRFVPRRWIDRRCVRFNSCFRS